VKSPYYTYGEKEKTRNETYEESYEVAAALHTLTGQCKHSSWRDDTWGWPDVVCGASKMHLELLQLEGVTYQWTEDKARRKAAGDLHFPSKHVQSHSRDM
jgi:hypothetical protein